MKAKEILSALKLGKSTHANDYCKQLAAFYSVLNELKKDIVKAEIVGEKIKDSIKGVNFFTQKIVITTKNGCYSFLIPIENKFYNAVCELVGINYMPLQVVKTELEQMITIETNVLQSIKKATKFVSKDALRPSYCCILLHFKDGFCKVVSTDAHRLYYSKLFIADYAGERKVLLTNGFNELANVNVKDSEFIELSIYADNKAVLAGIEVELFNTDYGKYPDYEQVIPNYSEAMVFNRIELNKAIKAVSPFANKVSNEIKFHLNGSIELSAKNVDYELETVKTIPYISKSFVDADISFNGKFFNECLSVFKDSSLKFLTNGSKFKPALITNDIDTCLLMPLCTND